MLATVLGTVAGLGLVTLPAGPAGAAAAACTWQKSVWDLPAGSDQGTIDAYAGERWAIGVSGNRPWLGGGLSNPHATLWDNGKVALRLDGDVPHLRDVNASGLIVGDTVVNDEFVAVTVDHDGTTHTLPGDPAWDGYDAWAVNDRGDIVGWGGTDLKPQIVVWPASAPGTYRVLPAPGVMHIQDMDNQGRIIAQGTYNVGSVVWDTDGQWRELESGGAPYAIRDGRVVGSPDSVNTVAEWTARGALVRTIGDGAISAMAIGGNGTVGGNRFVGSQRHAVLWRDGVVSDPLTTVAAGFALQGLSNDEKTLVGIEAKRPTEYRCS